jgi:hypothetical protein
VWLLAAVLVLLEVLLRGIGVSSSLHIVIWSTAISIAIVHVSSWVFGDDVSVVSVDLLLLLLLLLSKVIESSSDIDRRRWYFHHRHRDSFCLSIWPCTCIALLVRRIRSSRRDTLVVGQN